MSSVMCKPCCNDITFHVRLTLQDRGSLLLLDGIGDGLVVVFTGCHWIHVHLTFNRI